jgi:hypothetical protein
MMTRQHSLNRRRARQETLWQAALVAGNLAILGSLAAIVVFTGHLILTTALTLPALITQAATLKGM